jgi:hypothetical protein
MPIESGNDNLTPAERAARDAFFNWELRGCKNAWEAIVAAVTPILSGWTPITAENMPKVGDEVGGHDEKIGWFSESVSADAGGRMATIELESMAGRHIDAVCEVAATLAQENNCPVHFEFNGTHVTAQPGESGPALSARWNTDFEASAKAWRESPEYKAQEAKREAEEKAAREAHMIESASTETEMRAARVPWPKTKEQLAEYIDSLVNRSHDYGTCVYAMSMAAEAAFNYVSGQLGVTGFQASCADLDLLRRTRGVEGPFIILKGEDMLYPQYNLVDKLKDAMEEWEPWAREEARKKLKETTAAHPQVIAHWKELAD